MDREIAIREIQLSQIPKIGSPTIRLILNSLGGLNKVFSANRNDFESIEGISSKGADYIYNSLRNNNTEKKAEAEYEFIHTNGYSLFFIEDLNFPAKLKECSDSPIILYGDGNIRFNHSLVVSVVGTRKATAYGKKLTYEFVKFLKDEDILLVSGLAYGIDIEAHRTALEFDLSTIGILGHGLDNLYPSIHQETSRKMKKNGGLLTEFISGTAIVPGLFPRRNRIIAGLCDALVVIEASEKGGALISADLANSYDREVFAFPGRINDPYSIGCLKLIRDQKAQMILNGEDFQAYMGYSSSNSSTCKTDGNKLKTEKPSFSENEILIEKFITQSGKVTFNELLIAFPKLTCLLSEIMLNLEITGQIRSLPGKLYERV